MCVYACAYVRVCVRGPVCACVGEMQVCVLRVLGCVIACTGVSVCGCISVCMCSMVVVGGQREGRKFSFYGFLQFRVTATAAKLMTSGVVLFLKYYSFLPLIELKGRKGRKRRLIVLVDGKLLLPYTVNMKLSHQIILI